MVHLFQHKCFQYWPDGVGRSYETPDGRLVVTTTSVKSYTDFNIRTFDLKTVSVWEAVSQQL